VLVHSDSSYHSVEYHYICFSHTELVTYLIYVVCSLAIFSFNSYEIDILFMLFCHVLFFLV